MARMGRVPPLHLSPEQKRRLEEDLGPGWPVDMAVRIFSFSWSEGLADQPYSVSSTLDTCAVEILKYRPVGLRIRFMAHRGLRERMNRW